MVIGITISYFFFLSKYNSNCAIHNSTYSKTELVENNQQPPPQANLASPNSVPFKNMTKTPKPQNVSPPAMENSYDMVTTENSAPDDTVDYSDLNCENLYTSRMEKLFSLSDEDDSGTDPINHHTLEVEESQM